MTVTEAESQMVPLILRDPENAIMNINLMQLVQIYFNKIPWKQWHLLYSNESAL